MSSLVSLLVEINSADKDNIKIPQPIEFTQVHMYKKTIWKMLTAKKYLPVNEAVAALNVEPFYNTSNLVGCERKHGLSQWKNLEQIKFS